MSCLRLEQIYGYLEGDLGPAERRLVEHHLDICRGCRRAVAERKVLHEVSLSLPPLEVPPDFSTRILAKIKRRSEAPFARLIVIAAGAGGLGLAILGTLLVMGLELPAFLVTLTRSIWSSIGRAGAALGKILDVLAAGLKLGGAFLESFWKAFETIFTVFLPKGTAAPAFFLGLGLSLLLLIGARRLLLTGERP